ncbi:Fe(3+)-binding periplasmic protein precursor [Andreesenia angusta]|uniref:Fe(3+)-binding periplasmic protein n=1 Tax=Andreesenia angusta TaxID=39480 RepID=A0A1S1V9F9_9FIRM|nr:extracellular solute-binding protein [Andreesenia angusta]OHW63045.1 Fe(3+)-binding periplasmic protein precursor [Andreesenia angusta]
MNLLKRFLLLTLSMVLAISLAACSNSDKSSSEDAKSGAESEAKTQDLEEKLVIYSTHGEDMLEVVADGFTEKTGVEVEFINLKGELADRVRAEKENPQADIMYGGASSLFITMAEEDLFESTKPSWEESLDAKFKDSEGRWFGVMQTPVVMFYNNEALSEEEAPKSWADLADPKYKDMIVSRDYVSSSQRATIVSLLDYYSSNSSFEEGVEYLKQLDQNTKNYYGSGSLHFQAVGKSEAPISYGVLSSITDNVNNNGMPLTMIDAEEGSIVLTDAIAAIKNSPHPNAAAAFIDYAGSEEVQVKLANEFDRMPTLAEAVKQGPEWMQTPLKEMDINWGNVAKNELEWLNLWDTEIRDSGKDIAE